MGSRLRVGVLCGGRSAEHEVSLQSARSIVDAIDRDVYEVLVLGIDKQGGWHLLDPEGFLEHPEDPRRIRLKTGGARVVLAPGDKAGAIREVETGRTAGEADVVFPVLHGPYGEDGTVQGMLKMLRIPFVGSGVLGSAAAMDKEVTKRLLTQAGVPAARYMVLESASPRPGFEEVRDTLGIPCFVKPANLGSSVGVRCANARGEFDDALEEAFSWDSKVLVEEFVEGREIECSILGNQDPEASVPGEIVTDRSRHLFYSYEAKYIDEEGAALEIPAGLAPEVRERVRDIGVKAFLALGCEGMARVDFFVKREGDVLVNELNTIPGFTKISMYPKLWEASGLPYPELIHRLIRLALDRHRREEALRSSLSP
ncbi:MAG: D-alanine--D-alanine ligase [Desulfobacteraceae bacterium]